MLEPWIETHSGKRMYFLAPTPEMIDIDDIAHSLSLQCRFSGHTSQFYSVAEHSINVARELQDEGPEVQLQGLLHDASEAYLLDVPSPVKQFLGGYKEMEDGLMKAIFTKYGVKYPMSMMVKEADHVMLKREANVLLPSKGASWVNDFPTIWETDCYIDAYPPTYVKELFMDWFNYLVKENANASRTTAVI
jgi:Predicted hydrolases of HD superfamily